MSQKWDALLSKREGAFVRWYDYLWFLIPIAGVAFFVAAVLARDPERIIK